MNTITCKFASTLKDYYSNHKFVSRNLRQIGFVQVRHWFLFLHVSPVAHIVRIGKKAKDEADEKDQEKDESHGNFLVEGFLVVRLYSARSLGGLAKFGILLIISV